MAGNVILVLALVAMALSGTGRQTPTALVFMLLFFGLNIVGLLMGSRIGWPASRAPDAAAVFD